ncbi:valine--tRNA ligase [bacterium]|nr:valine--tRNA ligase [bacterium]
MSGPASELPKLYDPKSAQDRWYGHWLEKGYFRADADSSAAPYCIVIPPPNVTGALHLGHALNNTLQDILIRWRRMKGDAVLWMPGTDHAGIATQAVVEKRLFQQEKKTRHDLGRDELVRRIWSWKDEYEARILSQLKAMGASCDWSRTRFTLDPVCARAVRQTFFRLFVDNKIYRGKRLVNWDTFLRTAVADDEIYYEDTQGSLWSIRYPVAGSPGEYLVVATTRPETMLGDTAVAVHPDDPRYKHLIGKEIALPLTDRRIPVIADGLLVDPAFGTGCVKVTPAHDPNDYQTGLRHKLPMINLLNPDGTYNENAPAAYRGLPVKEVRKRVLADLEAAGLLESTQPHALRLNLSHRSATPIEPYLSDQWFVRMDEFADKAIEAVTSGQVKFHPERYAKSYIDWLGEKRDWCVSRQLWWGHRIPIWYCESSTEADLQKAFAGRSDVAWHPAESGSDRSGWLICALDDLTGNELGPDHVLEQDADVLDTWFSSALWPHSTLGWPEKTADLAKFYPTSVLSTARDIITLWVARMVIMGQYNCGQVPFRDVFIHPVIMDGQGRRMSKSLGNGIDPVDIIDIYGADTLRFGLASAATETQDLRLPIEKIRTEDGREINSSERFDQAKPFANKLWNAARFVLTNLDDYAGEPVKAEDLSIEDRWILSALRSAVVTAEADLERFAFADLAKSLRDFTWNDFCDWAIEFAKPRLKDESHRPVAQAVLVEVLDTLVRLLHPIVPFVTEEIWQALNAIAPRRGLLASRTPAESVCIAPWPKADDIPDDPGARAQVELWMAGISALRNIRAERNIPRDARLEPVIRLAGADHEAMNAGLPKFRTMAGVGDWRLLASDAALPADTEAARERGEVAAQVLPRLEILVPLGAFIDRDAEKAKLQKGIQDIDKQLAAIDAKLSNASFVERAPAELVETQRQKRADLVERRQALESLSKTFEKS